jgi:hypothetical protein
VYTLPLSPYHYNLREYWRRHRGEYPDEDFWSWVRKYYGASLIALQIDAPEQWSFKDEAAMIWFKLKWA